MSEQKFTLSNFRKEETIQDWPLGSNRQICSDFLSCFKGFQ